MICTWEGCAATAAHDETSRLMTVAGEVWARLCSAHHEQWLAAGDAKATLRAWVKAQGGARAAAERMGTTIAVPAETLVEAFAALGDEP